MRQRQLAISVSVFVILLLAIAGNVRAQSESGSAGIAGTVRDSQGRVVPGATITARHRDTNIARTAVSDDAGRFSFPAMPVGPYALDATLSGFQPVRLEGLVLSVGETRQAPLVLAAAGVSESVTVTADASAIDRTGTATATVISERAISGLPIR